MSSTATDTVTLTRIEYEALMRRIEDAEDLAVSAQQRAREEALGKEVARADYLPVELVKRMLAGESPVRIWREHRNMTARQLAQAAEIPPSYLSEIETGKKPGSFDAMTRIARALKVQLDDLACATRGRKT
jgi:DNA-binding Xre family transcriptional regulator